MLSVMLSLPQPDQMELRCSGIFTPQAAPRQTSGVSLKVCTKQLYTLPQQQFITNLSYIGESLSRADPILMVCVVIMCGLVFKNVQVLAKHVCRPYNLPNYYH